MDLHVDTAALDQAATDMRGSADRLGSHLSTVEEAATRLRGQWTGAASDAAQAQIQQILLAGRRRVQVLHAGAAAVADAVEQYRRLDRTAARQLQ